MGRENFQVVFIGKNGRSSLWCSEPSYLTIGKIYSVKEIKDRGIQIDYILEEVSGFFNSKWFRKMEELPSTYFATSQEAPIERKVFNFMILTFDNGIICTKKTVTGIAESVTVIGRNTYRVECNSVLYIVAVIS